MISKLKMLFLLKTIIQEGKTPVFDCDQVLFHRDRWNMDLVNIILDLFGEVLVATHGCSIATAPFPWRHVECQNKIITDKDGKPIFDENLRPLMVKILSDDYVLFDDRADEWKEHSGRDNYIKYEWYG